MKKFEKPKCRQYPCMDCSPQACGNTICKQERILAIAEFIFQVLLVIDIMGYGEDE